jgi:hypothetical protein
MTTKSKTRTKKAVVTEEVLHTYDGERLVTKHDKAAKVKETVTVGRHLTVTRSSVGVSLAWDWPALLAEVQAVTGDLVGVTEQRVAKTRARKPAAKKTTKVSK